ncbi:acyl-CoA dehydrogenase family protein [Aeromicrobium sp. UC242_57]|uniref:acyl-CoA dehydrogenase family protein n=1 Tax=Aeromicrobium sp. UC242_57 TaxID=3374624 RepID=UPI003791D7B4
MALLGLERGDEAATNPIMFRAEVDRLIGLVHERGLGDDELVRDEVARAYTKAEIMRYLGLRILTGWLKGEPSGTEASVSKLLLERASPHRHRSSRQGSLDHRSTSPKDVRNYATSAPMILVLPTRLHRGAGRG